MASFLEQVPGYREAVDAERALRDLAFVPAVEPIVGVGVVPLTLMRYHLLRLAGNPFIVGGSITAAAVVQFLWVVSAEFREGDLKGRDAFIRRAAALKFVDAVAGIRAYLTAALVDVDDSATSSIPIASWLALVVDALAREYGWTRETIFALPVAEAMQYLRCIDKRHGGTVLNPMSDAVKMRWLKQINDCASN